MNDNMIGGSRHNRRRVLWGITLIGAGCLFLLDRLDMYDMGEIWRYWPLWMSMAGLIEMISAIDVRDVTRGLIKVVAGAWIYACINNLWGLDFGNSWPILMIAYGLCELLNGVASRNKQSEMGLK